MPKLKTTNSKGYILDRIFIGNENGCFTWNGPKNNNGYGCFIFNKERKLAHRKMYELFNNVILPEDICVCHTCDNRICVNPNHLFIGSRIDNNKDRHNKGRTSKVTRNNKLSKDDVVNIIIDIKNGMGRNDISNKYNISKPNISKIWLNQIWKSIERGV